MKSTRFCSHANEIPDTCLCPEDCYCRVNACLPYRDEIPSDVEREANQKAIYIVGRYIPTDCRKGLERDIAQAIQQAAQKSRPKVEYRYFIYNVDKHQSSPTFCNVIPEWVKSDSEACLTVVVDLQTMKRLWCGEWAVVDLREQTNG